MGPLPSKKIHPPFALAIVGSTGLGGPASRKIILDAIERYKPAIIISGGADGIDKFAAQIGRELGLQVDERKPDIQRWEDEEKLAPNNLPPGSGPVWTNTVTRKGFKTRNSEIADNCHALVRIAWDPVEQEAVTGKKPTYGSGWTRDRAMARGIPTEEYTLKLADDGKEPIPRKAAGAISKPAVAKGRSFSAAQWVAFEACVTLREAKLKAAIAAYAARLRMVDGCDAPMERAGGNVVCSVCNLQYHDHPKHPVLEFLTVLCDGSLVKL